MVRMFGLVIFSLQPPQLLLVSRTRTNTCIQVSQAKLSYNVCILVAMFWEMRPQGHGAMLSADAICYAIQVCAQQWLHW